MSISKAEFIISSAEVDKCPKSNKPEYAFIGRSNVGKSSLINMLTNMRHLAKISSKPGKTQLINHFDINNGEWYLVDLPGYGFAKVAKSLLGSFDKIIRSYILERESLVCLFVLVDCRHEPQKNDVEFMNWLGENGVPFVIVFTKADKLTKSRLIRNTEQYKKELLNYWESLPQMIISSANTAKGKDEIVSFIEETNKTLDF